MDVKRLPLYFIAFVYYNLSVETIAGEDQKALADRFAFFIEPWAQRGAPHPLLFRCGGLRFLNVKLL